MNSVADIPAMAPAASRKKLSDAAALRPAPELSVIVPTYRENSNIPFLLERLRGALDGCDWEVIFVDDNSPDGTAETVRAFGQADHRVRCIWRIGRRGLAGACLEGMLASQACYVAVMDADLQHDEAMLMAMLVRLRESDLDLVVASRDLAGEAAAALSAPRALASRTANAIVRRVLGVALHDPMSGFFMIRRDVVERLAPELSTQGFKILFDIVATARGRLRIVELPARFSARASGESKLDVRVALDFIQLLVAKLSNNAVSFRFVLFCLVGLTGVGIHMSVLALLHAASTPGFATQQAIATVAAIAWNFTLNNSLTYHDQRLSGLPWIGGLLRFEVICAVGALSNVGIASWIYGFEGDWWVAGLAGAAMGAVWNYVVSAAFVWRQR